MARARLGDGGSTDPLSIARYKWGQLQIFGRDSFPTWLTRLQSASSSLYWASKK